MEEVKQLDNQWEEIAKAQANLNALNEQRLTLLFSRYERS